MTELEENLDAINKERKMVLSYQGKEKLRECVKRGEIARTRAHIRGYAKKTLEGWQAYW